MSPPFCVSSCSLLSKWKEGKHEHSGVVTTRRCLYACEDNISPAKAVVLYLGSFQREEEHPAAPRHAEVFAAAGHAAHIASEFQGDEAGDGNAALSHERRGAPW